MMMRLRSRDRDDDDNGGIQRGGCWWSGRLQAPLPEPLLPLPVYVEEEEEEECDVLSIKVSLMLQCFIISVIPVRSLENSGRNS